MRYLLAFFLLATPCLARLGETLTQCTARYGPSVAARMGGPGVTCVTFEKDRVRITVDLWQGKCELIQYAKLDPEKLTGVGDFTAPEFNLLLAANGGARAWLNLQGVDALFYDRITRDGSFLAAKSTLTGHVTVQTADCYQRRKKQRDEERAKKKASEKRDLNGF